MRSIFLPELKSIQIKNYTLYPNALDYTFNFVKGFNLILGGNGMGKTTFVSLIKYALLGNYKKQYEYTRTYKENKIEKRERNPDDFFRNRIDNSVVVQSDPTVTINFIIKDVIFTIVRGLKDIQIENIYIDGVEVEGESILESKYEYLKSRGKEHNEELSRYLPNIYEREFEELAGISFDDLIFFVNYILFFGEDHRTILWDERVQKELFNTFFNSPELNMERQEAEREAKYLDSRARHKSEDKRAIRKVLEKVERNEKSAISSNIDLLKLQEKVEKIDIEIVKTHARRRENSTKISVLENERNLYTSELDELESKRNTLINSLSFNEYKLQHRLYDTFLKNIQANHICPLCSSKSEELYTRAINNQERCWVCDSEIHNSSGINHESKELLNTITTQYSKMSILLKSTIKDINTTDSDSKKLDIRFKELDFERRNDLIRLRELEFQNAQQKNPNELQPFYDEIDKLSIEQDEFSRRSEEKQREADQIAALIEGAVMDNVLKFSAQFSLYAQKFLGVECKLTYDRLDNDAARKFYPVISGSVRKSEYELSESQRFFIDHSFRMSILSHFYTAPTFYIIETPDSSLDLSYEKNAADVFGSFLEKPYNLILTSNLNNSSFVKFILEDNEREHAIVPLFEIGKKSTIQEGNITLRELYKDIINV